ncbi:MAG: hypothetical protein Q8P52_00050 [bacterium]|nr:hypothetical protein [bacterium]
MNDEIGENFNSEDLERVGDTEDALSDEENDFSGLEDSFDDEE